MVASRHRLRLSPEARRRGAREHASEVKVARGAEVLFSLSSLFLNSCGSPVFRPFGIGVTRPLYNGMAEANYCIATGQLYALCTDGR